MTHLSPSLTWPGAAYRERTAAPAADNARGVWSRVRSVGRRLAALVGGFRAAEIPDRLREDAGLPRRDPPRRKEWWELRW